MKNLIYLPLLFLIFLSACSKEDNVANLEIPENSIAMKKEDGKIVLIKDFTQTRKELISEMVKDKKVFNGSNVELAEVEIKNFSIEAAGEGRAYMLFNLLSGDNTVSVAQELLESTDGYYTAMGGETHSCTSNASRPCTGCVFRRDENQKIIGCDCSAEPLGICNHSVTVTEIGIE